MKKEILSDALDEMSDDIIERTARLRSAGAKRTRNILAWAAAFACTAALAVLIIAAVGRNRAMKEANNAPTAEPEQTTEAPTPTAAPPEQGEFSPGEASMIAFFIYNGRQYRHFTSSLEGDVGFEKLGNQLGTAVMKIDEWSTKQDYTELSGSVGGPFYEIEGFDPNFVLGLSYMYPHRWSPFVCAEGLALEYGRDLYEDLLHLDTLLAEITYESYASRNYSRGEAHSLSVDMPEIRALLAAMNEAKLIPIEEVLSGRSMDGLGFLNSRQYYIHFGLGNGLTATVGITYDGYLTFNLGMVSETAIIKLPDEVFDAVYSMMESGAGMQIHIPSEFEKAYDECVNDKTLGVYIPEYVPEGLAPMSAELTRSEGGETISLMLDYSGSPSDSRSYLINISSDLRYHGDCVITPDELSVERLEKLVIRENDFYYVFAVLDLDGAFLEFNGSCIDAETAYRILSSVRTDRP